MCCGVGKIKVMTTVVRVASCSGDCQKDTSESLGRLLLWLSELVLETGSNRIGIGWMQFFLDTGTLTCRLALSMETFDHS